MRKLFSLFLVSLLCLGLVGCGSGTITVSTIPQTTAPQVTAPTVPPETIPPTEPPTEPVTEPTEPVLANTLLYGIDITGMSPDEIKNALVSAIENYNLTLTVNALTFQFTASDLSMSLSEESLESWITDTIAGTNPSATGLITYDTQGAMDRLKSALTRKPVNASVVYSSALQRFQLKSHTDGTTADLTPANSALVQAIQSLSPIASARVSITTAPAEIPDSDPRVSAAVNNANSYLELKISYTYEAPGIPTTIETISVDDLASFLKFGENLSVSIHTTAIQDYVTRMSYKNGGVSRKGFVTSYGTTISQTVDYYSAALNQEAMYSDLLDCLINRISGNRKAPFLPAGISNMPYGGSYIEIDLDNQRLWCYRDGKLVIESLLVSGKVSNGAWTPAGVYSIYGKDTETYLVGPTWCSYVDYWMPFNGGIGLHDANWRDEFGGQIYMYDGSHGCINLPPENAGIIYNNISIGTKVILYGGAHSAGKLTQELRGTDRYTVTQGADPFSLDIRAKYTSTVITYTSSDPSVVTVDAQGNVTIHGPGTAEITVFSEKLDILSSATFTVKITVEATEPDPTDPTEPEETEPEPSEPVEPEETEPTEPEPTIPAEPEETEPEATEPTEPDTQS